MIIMDNATIQPTSTTERKYGKIIITLENSLIPEDRLDSTPSVQDGLDKEVETDLRILGCELIQSSGILLKLPQVAMATAQVLFQRFYYSKSFVKHQMEHLAMACINLASKIEEAPRRIRDVINVFHHIKQIMGQKKIQPLILDQAYVNLKNQVIKAERRVLKELGFCVHVKHPHKIIVTYLQVLKCERNTKLIQTAWNYMNDGLRTDIFVKYDPETIACACIYLAARQLKVVLPTKPPWFSVFTDNSEEDIHNICLTILRLYARPKPNYEELERKVAEMRRILGEAKLKAKGQSTSAAATPNPGGFSPGSRTGSPSKDDEKKKDGNKSSNKIRDSSNQRDASNHHKKKRSRSRSRHKASRHSSSRSPSPKRDKRDKVLPRGYQHLEKERRRVEGRSRHDEHRQRKKKRSHSMSRSRSRTPERRPHKKYKEKSRHRKSHSPSHESRRHKNRSESRDYYKR